LILSEFKLDMAPTTYSFPQRNRIVAGLADVVCVPEAREGSGSLITVDFALQMRKPVYGAPNSIFASASSGLLPYLADGRVQVLSSVDTILSRHFAYTGGMDIVTPVSLSLPGLEQDILHLCVAADMGLEQLCASTGKDVSALLEALTMLEMHGLILQSAPNVYRSAQKIAK
jgi:DNA processing protein